MEEPNDFCEAVNRVDRLWRAGQRGRDFSQGDLAEGLRIHRHQWQESFVRLLLYFHTFDAGNLSAASGHIIHAANMMKGLWNDDDPFLIQVRLEQAFVSARLQRPLDSTEELLALAEMLPEDAELTYPIRRARAAYQLATGQQESIATLDEYDSWLRAHPESELDNMQAELDWVSAMREEYYRIR